MIMTGKSIEVVGLSKRFGRTLAVDNLTFTVRPGVVTGFLGPNGAGKTTTMRMILGLDRPTAGTVRIGGQGLDELAEPLRTVGGLLDAGWVHPRRSARSHLRWLAALAGMPASRVDEVLEFVGLSTVAGKRAGTFSLGMRQRLGVAAALIGDPEVLILDEPANGLDPEGITWFRGFAQRFAASGRTVLVSSHLIAEMALTASEVVIIGRGKLIAQQTTAELVGAATVQVRVRSSDPTVLAAALRADGLRPVADGIGLCVPEATTDRVGKIASAANIVVYELVAQQASLEAAFLELTRGDTEFVTGVAA
jgi:ABC-2 type transport system ATP-binding protein